MTELHKIAFDYRNAVLPDDAHEAWQELEQYVKQLINNEREECAQIAHDTYEGFGVDAKGVDFVKERIIAAIRARGQV